MFLSYTVVDQVVQNLGKESLLAKMDTKSTIE